MNQLLTPVKTTTSILRAENIHSDHVKPSRNVPLESVEDVIAAVNGEPDLGLLRSLLDWLRPSKKGPEWRVAEYGPKNAEVKFSFLEKIIPNFWPSLYQSHDSEHKNVKILLLRFFSDVAGVASLASHCRLTLRTFKSSPSKDQHEATAISLNTTLSFTAQLLKPQSSVYRHWKKLQDSSLNATQKALSWKEYASVLASGRVLSLAAEAQKVMSEQGLEYLDDAWITDGGSYSTWLGKNLSFMLHEIDLGDGEAWKALKLMLSKSLTLGYNNELLRALFQVLLSGDEHSAQRSQRLVSELLTYEQKRVLFSLLHILSKDPRQRLNPKFSVGTAAFLLHIIGGNENRMQILCEWLVGASAAGLKENSEVQKAVVLAIVTHPDLRRKYYERALQTFGDKLYIQHAPLSDQEAYTRVLSLLAGHLFRLDRSYLQEITQQSLHLNMVSNRLASSSSQSKTLGMIFATVISSMIDPEERMLKFDGISEDVKPFDHLARSTDRVGIVADLRFSLLDDTKVLNISTLTKMSVHEPLSREMTKHVSRSKIVAIEEITGSGQESEDEEFTMYAKPDTDESDEEEDATLVQRNKPTAPVYIRDLLAGLRDTENYDRYRLALQHVADLIRRKTNFGSEVAEHIEELATQLIGLDDKYEMEDFQHLRISGMIAVLLADPSKMGPWFSATFFNGDYSMSQRISVLSTLGIGARELAGMTAEDTMSTKSNGSNPTSFPSKKLPDKLHKIYTTESAPVNDASKALESSILRPIAAEAADQVTGPNVLKVRTFSSRLAVEGKRQKAIPNQLAMVVANAFFLPLVGRWQTNRQAYGDKSIHDSPLILSHYIKTLSLIINASGPSTLSLPQMTTEFWDLLLALRSKAEDPSVMEALLFGILTLLNINEGSQGRLAADHSRQLLETREWVQMVYQNLSGDGKEDHHRQSLAEAVLMIIAGVINKYQQSMLGDLADFT